ncbi:hypothetical protein RF11_05384 [Thelohanellus kitauei]|uniref:Uncharacterized protein n=1 Tax=Thelohanellus kitauei TaxID=669202 RepID=A0A0C2MUG8_THEKT|nr:hypothetical protein RF11_05384 [Thelohanellus kitauei]
MFGQKNTQAKAMYICSITMAIMLIPAQKHIDVNDVELHVVVIGDIGFSEYESVIKRTLHSNRAFQLGINLGDNVYPWGSTKHDFQRLGEVFGLSFPLSIFPFDFHTVLGNHDHEGDIDTQILYHLRYEPRVYMPSRNYFSCIFSMTETLH